MQSLIKEMTKTSSESRGTSLITIFIQPGSDLWLVSNKLVYEQSTANNIKNKVVRKDTLSAIKLALYQIRNCKLK